MAAQIENENRVNNAINAKCEALRCNLVSKAKNHHKFEFVNKTEKEFILVREIMSKLAIGKCEAMLENKRF